MALAALITSKHVMANDHAVSGAHGVTRPTKFNAEVREAVGREVLWAPLPNSFIIL